MEDEKALALETWFAANRQHLIGMPADSAIAIIQEAGFSAVTQAQRGWFTNEKGLYRVTLVLDDASLVVAPRIG